MERLNCVNRQFSKENSVNRNDYVNSTKWTVHKICNDSCCKISYSHDLSSDNLNKRLEPEECVTACKCDEPSDYVFVDVGSNLIGSEYLIEEDDDICKVSSETLFTDKDIDYNLFKNVTIERRLKNSSKENEMHNHNLETAVFNINDICIGDLDNYDKKPSIDIDYTTTSTVVSVSRGFEKVNTHMKEEKSIEDVLVPQNKKSMSPETKKEETVYNEEVTVVNESIIDIKLHPVEGSPDVSTNYLCVLDKNIKTGFIVLSKSVNSNFQEGHTEYSEEVPVNSDIGDVMDLKPLEKNETLQNKRESHLKLWNELQTLNRTCSELQIKPQTNSADDTGAAGVEECNNRVNEDDVNTQSKNKNDALCRHHRKRKSRNTTDRHYICKVCDKNFTQLCKFKAHKRIHTGDRPFVCDTCGKTFTQMAALKRHVHIHTGDRPFVCDTCGKTFKQTGALKYHIRIHTRDRPFGCDTCSKTFTRKDYLKSHIRIHTGDRPFGCDTCGKTFKQLTSLKCHKHIHTGDRPFGCSTGDRPFGCDTCGKTFPNKSRFKEHIRIHIVDRPFGCSTCGKAFIQLCELEAHKRIHTGDWPFSCNTCGKTFTKNAHLEGHILIHTGDRPFVCDTCGKTFTKMDHLKCHIRIHTGDRPFGCDTCGKTFTRKDKLQVHIRSIHTGDRPFGCDTCGKTFKLKYHLKTHIRIHTV